MGKIERSNSKRRLIAGPAHLVASLTQGYMLQSDAKNKSKPHRVTRGCPVEFIQPTWELIGASVESHRPHEYAFYSRAWQGG